MLREPQPSPPAERRLQRDRAVEIAICDLSRLSAPRFLTDRSGVGCRKGSSWRDDGSYCSAPWRSSAVRTVGSPASGVTQEGGPPPHRFSEAQLIESTVAICAVGRAARLLRSGPPRRSAGAPRLRLPRREWQAGRIQRQSGAHRRRSPCLHQSLLQRSWSTRVLHPRDLRARAVIVAIRRSRGRSAATGRARLRVRGLGNDRRLHERGRALCGRDGASHRLQRATGLGPGLRPVPLRLVRDGASALSRVRPSHRDRRRTGRHRTDPASTQAMRTCPGFGARAPRTRWRSNPLMEALTGATHARLEQLEDACAYARAGDRPLRSAT